MKRRTARQNTAAAETREHVPVNEKMLAGGLMLLTLSRPWLDGITFPFYNYFFLWGVFTLFGLWGIAQVLQGYPFRQLTPSFLFLGFLLVAFCTRFTTLQMDNTIRAFHLWAGYGLLFFLVLNGLRSRATQGAVLGAFLVVSCGEAVWSCLHLKYVLPAMREAIAQDPSILKAYFGEAKMSPELHHRLMMNRAYGSLLFPNALAAMMIMAIPPAAGALAHCGLRLRKALTSGTAGVSVAGEKASGPSAGQVAVATWSIAFFVLVFFFFIYTWTANPYENPLNYQIRLVFMAGVLPVVLAGTAFLLTRRHGFKTFWLMAQTLFLFITAVLCLYVLYKTFSRGGVLGLVMACGSTAAILALSGRTFKGGKTPAKAMYLVLAVLIVLSISWAPLGLAQEETGAPAIAGEGYEPGLQDVANLGSFRLRLQYWDAAWQMIKDYPIFGVGFGNFGSMYPAYQKVGAGEVQQAHNDYLQVFAETGVFGILCFAAFWSWFVYWGARRIYGEPLLEERLLLAGMYAGVLAFLNHSFVDFNFFNPTMAMLLFILAALFYGRGTAPQTGKETTGQSVYQYAAVPLLLAAMVLSIMSYRVYRANALLGEPKLVNLRLTITEEFLRLDESAFNPVEPPRFSYRVVSSLISAPAVLDTFSRIYIPTRGTASQFHLWNQAEPVTESAILLIDDVAQAKRMALEAFRRWLDLMEASDGLYNLSPSRAAQTAQWYLFLAEIEPGPTEKQRLVRKAVDWAEEGVRRSPMQSGYYNVLGLAYWTLAGLETADSSLTYYDKAMDNYRRAAELYPVSSQLREDLGSKLLQYGRGLRQAGALDKGQHLIVEGQKALERAAELKAAGH